MRRPMHVLITGAAGFLERRLCSTLLAHGSLMGSDGNRRGISELPLAGIAGVPDPVSRSVSISTLQGDLESGSDVFCDDLVILHTRYSAQ